MIPVNFPGATEIKKPTNMTDEECSSVWAEIGVDSDHHHYIATVWKPNLEELNMLNEGGGICFKQLTTRICVTSVFTVDKSLFDTTL